MAVACKHCPPHMLHAVPPPAADAVRAVKVAVGCYDRGARQACLVLQRINVLQAPQRQYNTLTEKSAQLHPVG